MDGKESKKYLVTSLYEKKRRKYFTMSSSDTGPMLRINMLVRTIVGASEKTLTS